ncbi:type 2 periplasmic-binding domain-containing protein [Aeoliella mucimassa]|uniref:hypothetical protein n=1 Tax=Aeoliella mucimassa TaxID=2527972 RepID=UPI0011A39992|nr:hypothetical protein [Aeoliella mucimassa]
MAQADNLSNLSDFATSLVAFGGPADIAGESDFGANGRQLADEFNGLNGFDAGWTMNTTFTPVAADLATGETRLLMEIGGTSNGTGLWLLDGVPTLALKTGAGLPSPISSVASDVSLVDNAAAIFSSYGSLSAGTSYSIAATWNANDTFTLAVQDNSTQQGVVQSTVVDGTSSSYNWYGNSTYNVGRLVGDPGSYGGLSGTEGTPFTAVDAVSMDGVSDFSNGTFNGFETLFWNEPSTLSVGSNLAVLTATIDLEQGDITISNPTSSSVTIDSATLIGGQGGFDDGNGAVQQLVLSGGNLVTIAAGSSAVLPGVSWAPSPFIDAGIALEVSGATTNTIVNYTGSTLLFGDYDGSGVVDAGDWPTLLASMNTSVADLDGIGRYMAGDLTGDGQVDRNDFRLLKELASGSAATSGSADAANVPEPATWGLIAVGITMCLCTYRRKSAVLATACVALLASTSTTAMAADIYMVSNTGEIRTFDGVGGTSGSVDQVGNFAGGTLVNTIAEYGTYQGFTSLPNGTVYGVNSAGGVDSWPTLADFTANTNLTTVSTGDPYGSLATESPRSGIHGFSFDGNTGGLYVVLEGPDENEGDLKQYSTLKNFVENNGTIYTPNGYAGNIMLMYYPDEDARFTTGLPNADAGPGSNYFHITGGGQFEGWEGTLTQSGYGMYGVGATPGGDGGGGNRSYQLPGFGNEVIGSFSIVPDTEEMKLLVDTSTGVVSLQRAAAGDRTIDFLRVSSPGSGLLGSGYLGLGANDEFPAGDGLGGEGWDLAPSNEGNISDKREYFAFNNDGTLGNSTISNSGDSIPLGLFYDTEQDLQDLVLYYDVVDPTTGEFISQSIIGGVYVDYVESTGLPGDYNSDGSVDLGDYTVWRDNLGADGSTLANRSVALNGSEIGTIDYMVWKANFGASSGSLASLDGTAVPEPTSGLALLGAIVLAALGYRRT